MHCKATIEPYLVYDEDGNPTALLRKVEPMARIHDKFLDCAISVYQTEEHAILDKGIGASGFLVGVPAFGEEYWLADGYCPQPNRYHVYAVTNRHSVSNDDGELLTSAAIRVNLKNGGSKPIKIEAWIARDTSDLAISPIYWDADFEVMFIGADGDLFVTEKDFDDSRYIGVGDDVFMVSRFIDREHLPRNEPIMRWGHVASKLVKDLPTDKIPAGKQDSFLVEVHSVSGYSGSPVFVRPFDVVILTLQRFFRRWIRLQTTRTGWWLRISHVLDGDRCRQVRGS